jgi:hypothetical protein
MFNGVAPTVAFWAGILFIPAAVGAAFLDGLAENWRPWRTVRDFVWLAVALATIGIFGALMFETLAILRFNAGAVLGTLLTGTFYALFGYWWVMGAWRRTRWGRPKSTMSPPTNGSRPLKPVP